MSIGPWYARAIGEELESAFALVVGYGVLMTSKLGTNEILLRYIATLVPWKI
jgi:hypothetical protein